ncbi:Leader peptidase (Prepilin peptidase) [Chitinispirillum alkaliphilum]|nr:Leader peptidase (Prepilin peptidase) [Chitinispirillum alkaliphilum]
MSINIILPGIFGLALGSFFNVLIWRIPKGISIVTPPSNCTNCGYRIRFRDNIPVLSYLYLRGKCRKCGMKISAVYPAVEVATAVLLAIIWQFSGFDLSVPWYQNIVPLLRVISILLLIPISIIDLRHYIIPDRFTLPFLAVSLAVSFLPGDLSPLQSILGALAGGGSLLFMGILGTYILKKEDSMGGGDIKMMAYLGALWGAQAALMGIVIAAFIGSLAGAVLMLTKKLDDEHRIPFGPFLAAGLAIAAFSGDIILSSYLNFADRLLGF